MGPDQEPAVSGSPVIDLAARLRADWGVELSAEQVRRTLSSLRIDAFVVAEDEFMEVRLDGAKRSLGEAVPEGYVAPKLTDLGSEPGPFADDDMRSPFHRELEEALAQVPTDPLALNSIAPQYRASLVHALLEGNRQAFLRSPQRVLSHRRAEGEVRHLRELLAGEVIRLLGEVYRPEGVQTWLSSSQACFGGRSASELLKTGDVELVLERAHQIADGNFA